MGNTEARNEAELQSIGHDLHDGPIQAVVSVVLELDGLRQWIERDHAVAPHDLVPTVERSKRVLQHALDDLRAVVRRLAPPEAVATGPSRDAGRDAISAYTPDPVTFGAASEVAWSEANEVAP